MRVYKQTSVITFVCLCTQTLHMVRQFHQLIIWKTWDTRQKRCFLVRERVEKEGGRERWVAWQQLFLKSSSLWYHPPTVPPPPPHYCTLHYLALLPSSDCHSLAPGDTIIYACLRSAQPLPSHTNSFTNFGARLFQLSNFDANFACCLKKKKEKKKKLPSWLSHYCFHDVNNVESDIYCTFLVGRLVKSCIYVVRYKNICYWWWPQCCWFMSTLISL